jgi:hypothetical protein
MWAAANRSTSTPRATASAKATPTATTAKNLKKARLDKHEQHSKSEMLVLMRDTIAMSWIEATQYASMLGTAEWDAVAEAECI